jgi:hypothetical protein
MNTAVNPGCDWLFPGGRAGQPLTAGALLQQLHVLGVHVTQTRTAAFRQLVLQAPPPSSPRPSATPPELPKTMSATAAGHGAATGYPHLARRDLIFPAASRCSHVAGGGAGWLTCWPPR